MGKSKVNVLKILISIVFGIAILGAWGYVIWKGEPFGRRYLSYGAIALCFLFSLLFIKKLPKKVFIMLALAANVAADYFLVFANSLTDTYKLIGVCIFCGSQLFYMLYTLSLAKGNGEKVINLGTRVALCLIAYFILPRYLALTVLEMIAVMYAINFVVTIFFVLLHIKTEWLTLIGMILFLLCDVHVGLVNGGIAALGITGDFANFLTSRDWAYYVYTPGVFLIALSSVVAKKKD